MNPVADGDDRVHVVVQDTSGDVPRTLPSNLEEILPSCLTVEFTPVVGVLQMRADIMLRRADQLRHLCLRHPRRLADETHWKAHNNARR